MPRDEYIVINCVIIIGNGIFMNKVGSNVNEYSLGWFWLAVNENFSVSD